MDRIDILREVVEKEGADVFYAREGKLRKALHETALTFADMEDLIEVCSTDRKLTKKILSDPDLANSRDLQKELVNVLGNRSIASLKDVHTAIYHYERKSVEKAEGEFDDGRFVYQAVPARKQCLALLRSVTQPGYELVIPDTVTVAGKEWKIVSISDACFENNTSLTSVKLPAGLETLGKNAFCNCSSLISVDIPRHLKTIGQNAFAYTRLTELVAGDYLENIESMAFYRCRDLKKVVLPKRTGQIGVGAFSGCTSLETVEIDRNNGRFCFEGGVLYSRKKDKIYQITGSFKGKLSPPRSLLSIEQYAAEDCQGLSEIDLPVSLTSIGACAFKGCTGLIKTKLPNTLTAIGQGAFENCTSLKAVSVPVSIRTIGRKAFAGCTSLETCEVLGTVKYSGMEIFSGCTGLNRVTIVKNSEHNDKDFPNNTRVKYVHG